MSMSLMSPAFEEGARIPQKYSRDGENLLPPLKNSSFGFVYDLSSSNSIIR